MALEPITRQEKIIAGQDLTPITRLEKFLKIFGGGGGSIPKPLTYDYMPEGYPKKDGWSIEWDGNTEGLTYIPIEEDCGLYKISDMVPTDDDLLGAEVEFLDSPGNTVLITEHNIDVTPNGNTNVDAGIEDYYAVVSIFRKDNTKVDGITVPEKGVYAFSYSCKFKMSKENITLMSTDFIPLASVTEPGLAPSLKDLFPVVLQQVHDEYFAGTEIQNPDYSSAQSIQEFALKNNSYGIFQPGKFSGKVLNAYDSITDKYLTVVLAASDKVECRKFTSGSMDIEQLWCISKDGVIIPSSTPDSTKKFKITVNDSGNISATEVT